MGGNDGKQKALLSDYAGQSDHVGDAATGGDGVSTGDETTGLAGFGDKNIDFFGSVCLVSNNITGPGMILIPLAFQHAGWIGGILLFGVIAVVAALAALYLIVAMQSFPGNGQFNKRLEFMSMVKRLFNPLAFKLTLFFFIFNLQVQNISSIVESAQTMDNSFVHLFGKSCALGIYGKHNSTTNIPTEGFFCITEKQLTDADSPFGDTYVISLGYLFVLAIAIPLGYVNLDDNIWVQKIGFTSLCGCIFVWTAQFIVRGLDVERVEPVNSYWKSTLATILFNYGYIVTLPSWINEKKPQVPVVRTIWISTVLSTILYLMIGIFGGMGLDYRGTDILTALNSPHTTHIWKISQIMTWVFPLAALVSGIPIFSIIIRYNLLDNDLCGKTVANVFSVLFPWVVALFFYAGDYLSPLAQWSGAILFGFLNFVVPIYTYISVHRRRTIDFPDLKSWMIRQDTKTPSGQVKGSIRRVTSSRFSHATLSDAFTNVDGQELDHLGSVSEKKAEERELSREEKHLLNKGHVEFSDVVSVGTCSDEGDDGLDRDVDVMDAYTQTPVQKQVTVLPDWVKRIQANWKYDSRVSERGYQGVEKPKLIPLVGEDEDADLHQHTHTRIPDDDFRLELYVAYGVVALALMLNVGAILTLLSLKADPTN